MPKGANEDTGTTTASGHLRDVIRELEIGLADLRGRRESVLILLQRRDEAQSEMERLGAGGLDLRAERTRLETVDNIMQRKAQAIMRELLNSGGLAAARREHEPPEEHWWWYLDRQVTNSVKRQAVRIGTIVVGVVALLLVVNAVMDRFFGPSPEERQAQAFTAQAEQSMMYGRYDEALPFYEDAVSVAPDLIEPRVRLGVLYQVQGRATEAEAALTAARELADNEAVYYILLARAYEIVNLAEDALVAANRAIVLAPDSAEAYLTRGSIHEGADHYQEALDDFDHAATLADAQGQSALYVLARTRLGMLMQRGPSPFDMAPAGGS
jgi:tetratricopeptide (TPR) repeat protein